MGRGMAPPPLWRRDNIEDPVAALQRDRLLKIRRCRCTREKQQYQAGQCVAQAQGRGGSRHFTLQVVPMSGESVKMEAYEKARIIYFNYNSANLHYEVYLRISLDYSALCMQLSRIGLIPNRDADGKEPYSRTDCCTRLTCAPHGRTHGASVSWILVDPALHQSSPTILVSQRPITTEYCRASSRGFAGSCRAAWQARAQCAFAFHAV